MKVNGPLDEAALLELTSHDLGLIAELTEIFQSEYPKLSVRLREAVAARSAPDVESAAHAIKSMVGTFCAQGAYALASELEEMGHAGRLEGVSELCSRLDRESERIGQSLRTMLPGGTS
jgi:HPt (histidine-containing phosphotransfer) domain-containing protein